MGLSKARQAWKPAPVSSSGGLRRVAGWPGAAPQRSVWAGLRDILQNGEQPAGDGEQTASHPSLCSKPDGPIR